MRPRPTAAQWSLLRGPLRSALVAVAMLVSPLVARAQVCDWAYDPTIGQPGLENGFIYAFTDLDGDLVAGGSFETAGGVPSPGCARWDGTSWSAMGNGFSGAVYALTHFQGSLYAFGQFAFAFPNVSWRTARWDGSLWQPLGPDHGLQRPSDTEFAEAYASVVYGDSLVVGGGFTRAGDQSVGLVAAWDGANWHPLGAGFDSLAANSGTCEAVFEPWVHALCVYEGDLIAGGSFALTAGGQEVYGIARWDGSAWHPMGSGVGRGPTWCGVPYVLAMTVWNGDLIVGGTFRTMDGQPMACVARWDGSAWHAMGTTWEVPWGEVWTLAVAENGELFAGGRGQSTIPPDPWELTRWNGTDWEKVGPHLTWASTSLIASLWPHGGDLYASGTFSGDADGDTMNLVTRIACNAVTAIGAGPRALTLTLEGANPFAGSTRLAFELPKDVARASLEIYDANGRRVRTLLAGPAVAGRHVVAWRGRNDRGARVASGVYYARLEAGNAAGTMRLVRL